MNADVAAVQDTVRGAVPLRIVGGGTWLSAGRPVRATRCVEIGRVSGIVDYTPGDLTLTARAGTTLGEIARVTGAEGQWLALDPSGSQLGTIGGTVATGSAGPLAHAYGLPRDMVLGLEIVTGTGAVVRGGGRVVKNVAGFDLSRLMTGAWGTLGIITEVTVRLRARPEVDRTVVVPVPSDWTGIKAVLERLARLAIEPCALELVSASLARHLSLGTPSAALLVRLAGGATSVAAQLSLLPDSAMETGESTWTSLRSCEPRDAHVFRCSNLPSMIGPIWDLMGDDVLVHATPSRGVVRCIGGDISQVDSLRRLGTVIGERLPAAAWTDPSIDMNHRLSRDLRRAFDPSGWLNPGILG